GLISFDIFPEGWDKTLCLGLLEREGLNAIYFLRQRDLGRKWKRRRAPVGPQSGRRAPVGKGPGLSAFPFQEKFVFTILDK
ncbi:unnamed protein product, partial [Tetraodon nigroviridis]